MSSYLLGKKVAYKFDKWFVELSAAIINEDDSTANYDAELIRDYFAQGLTPEETIKQLRSELPLPEDEEEDEQR